MEHARRTPYRLLLAAVLALVLIASAGCRSSATSTDRPAGAAQAAPAATSSAPSTAASDTKVCGTPPCMRYVSRSDTKKIADTVGAHPYISGVALHLVVGLLCGGILCILGEGVSVGYVADAAKHAAADHQCLRVRILPNGREWHLVDVAASNQSPYCTD
jgi:hypothetical protein